MTKCLDHRSKNCVPERTHPAKVLVGVIGRSLVPEDFDRWLTDIAPV